jgi:hypothetical protein
LGHIASDPACSQYKKPEQRQIFAAQVIDDRSDNEPPSQSGDLDDTGHTGENREDDPTEEAEEPQDENPDGSQYDDDFVNEEPFYEDYDGYEHPSDEDEPVYIRMVRDEEVDARTILAAGDKFNASGWQLKRDEIRRRYQRVWTPDGEWEFTPRHGIAHDRSCDVCKSYIDHRLSAEGSGATANSSAWKDRENYERDLVHLGWIIAYETERVSPEDTNNTILSAYVDTLRREKQRLCQQLASARQLNERATQRYKELYEELELERFDLSLRNGEAEFWRDEFLRLRHKCDANNTVLREEQPRTSTPTDVDVNMKSVEDLPNREPRPENPHPHNSIVGNETGDQRPVAGPDKTLTEHSHSEIVARIAAARDDTNLIQEREFRAAQRRQYMTGERPHMSTSDRHCMAVLVKVNGLDAYALLDTGSTAVSVTHDFARVAKLKMMQLDNPIALQLGTVGSRSMINYGVRAPLTLGPIDDADAYMDVVNIDRYDMILGTPFLRKHGLVLDFARNKLVARDQDIPTMTSGQEDLMITKRRAQRGGRPPPTAR